MMFRIRNGEPVFHAHECPKERAGQVMTTQELHDFAVKVLMEEYGETKAKVLKCDKKSPHEADFCFMSSEPSSTGEIAARKMVNVLVVYDDNLEGDISNIDTSSLIEDYRLYGIIPRVTFASAWCIYGDDCDNGKPAICGGDFCFRYYSVSVIPDERNEEHDNKLSAIELADKYAQAWRSLDASIVEPFLDKDFHYSSDWVFDEMPCRFEYLDYFRAKLKAISTSNNIPQVAVARNHQSGDVALLIKQGGENFLLTMQTKNGRIISARMQEYSGRFKPFNPEDELYMVHGNHFAGLMNTNVLIDKHLERIIKEAKLWRTTNAQVTTETMYEETTEVKSLMYGDGDARMLVILALDKKDNKNEFISIYPACTGVLIKARIDKVIEWDNQLEATVFCSINEFEFAFFAIDYYCNKNRYTVGELISIDLYALAMMAEEGQHGFSFEGERAIQWQTKIGETPEYDENGVVKPVRFNLERLVAFFAKDTKAPDEYEFQSPAADIETTSILGVDLYRAMIAICRRDTDEGRSNVSVPLYFRQDFFPDIHDGDPIRGELWLCGSITGQHNKELGKPKVTDTIAKMCADFEQFMKRSDINTQNNLMFILPKLSQLHLHDGYVLGAFKEGDMYGSTIRPYCYRKGAYTEYIPSMHKKYDDCMIIYMMISRSEAQSVPSVLPYFDIPFTEEGITQAWLLYNLTDFLPRGWHANYGSRTFIFDTERLYHMFPAELTDDKDDLFSLPIRDRLTVRNQIMSLDIESLLPRVHISGNEAVLEYTFWNSWRGLVKGTVNVKKDGNSVSFGDTKYDTLVHYKSDLRF